jgi:hypothetical protein
VGQALKLRISLADRAGALGQAAAVIGLHGGNILSIDIHRTDGSAAVDDLVVDFAERPHLDELKHDLATNASAALLGERPAEPTDPVVTGLLVAKRLVEGSPTDRDTSLAEVVAVLCSAPKVWVTSEDEATRFETGRLAMKDGRAVVEHTKDLPPALAAGWDDDPWLAAVPEPDTVAGRRIVFVARPGTMAFTDTEIDRIEMVMSLYRAISGR